MSCSSWLNSKKVPKLAMQYFALVPEIVWPCACTDRGGKLFICRWNHAISWRPLCTCVMYLILLMRLYILAQELAKLLKRCFRLCCWVLRKDMHITTTLGLGVGILSKETKSFLCHHMK
jgi:hypothetical protein